MTSTTEIPVAVAARPPRLLSLHEIERVRLLLRGGSAVDWFRLQIDSAEDARRFLRLQGADLDDDADRRRLRHLCETAAEYLAREHGYKIPPDLITAPTEDLLLFASGQGRRRERFFACLLLKVMHTVQHIEAKELRFRLPLSQSQLAEILKAKVDMFVEELRTDDFPLVRYEGGEKSQSSMVTKLLVKRENHGAAIYDRVRFRFVVDEAHDVMELLARMTDRLFPFNHVVPGQTANLLINFTSLIESSAVYREYASQLQIELGNEEQSMFALNEFSGPTYRVVSFVADIPLRIPDEVLATVDAGDLGRVILGLAEFQIVDKRTDEQNERGENKHERYRARQLVQVRDRLERGKRSARDDDAN